MSEIGIALIGAFVTAQFAVLQFLDQRRREMAVRRFIDDCLDPLSRTTRQAMDTLIDKSNACTQALEFAAAGVNKEMLESAAYERLRAPVSRVGTEAFRLSRLTPKAGASLILPANAGVIFQLANEHFSSPWLHTAIRAISSVPHEARETAARRLSEQIRLRRLQVTDVGLETISLAEHLGGLISIAAYQDGAFDLESAGRDIERVLLRQTESHLQLVARLNELSEQIEASQQSVSRLMALGLPQAVANEQTSA